MLKFIILLLPTVAILVTSSSDNFEEKVFFNLSRISSECLPEIGANDDDLIEIMRSQVPSRREGQCLAACFGEKLGWMQNGKFSVDGSLREYRPLKVEDPQEYAKLEKAINLCSIEVNQLKEEDKCELAVEALSCMRKMKNELGISVYVG